MSNKGLSIILKRGKVLDQTDCDTVSLVTKEALIILARLRRKGMPTLLTPQALNDLGYRTEDGRPFDFKLVKLLLSGEIGAKK